MALSPEPEPDTPVTLVVRLLAVIVFVTFVAMAPPLYLCAAHAKTQASTRHPTFSAAAFFDGSLMSAWELHLREASPVTEQVRGEFQSLLYRVGLFDSPQVHLGTQGWMFLREPLNFERAWWDGPAHHRVVHRLQLYRNLREACAKAGIRLLVVIVPDKDRIHADTCWPHGKIPEPKASLYGWLQREITESGLVGVDLERTMLAARTLFPDRDLFEPRDTHWSLDGAQVAAIAIRDRLRELGWDVAGPRCTGKLAYAIDHYTPDLVGMLGLPAHGSTVEQLRADRSWVNLMSADGSFYPEVCPRADVALVGTSYSAAYLRDLLPVLLERDVDTRGVFGGKGLYVGLFQTLERLQRGELAARTLIWEWPERTALGGDFDALVTVPGTK